MSSALLQKLILQYFHVQESEATCRNLTWGVFACAVNDRDNNNTNKSNNNIDINHY